jgi:amino acid adenylation domain-containing protein
MWDDSVGNDAKKRTLPPGHVRFSKSEIEQSIPDRFEAQAKLHPNRIAISDCGEVYSYTRLNEISNQVAHVILEARGDVEEPVALLLHQGAAPIIAILGILKAGKIYVALDPRLPRPELDHVIADCQPALLVTNTRHLSLAAELAGTGARCLNMETIAANIRKDNPNVSLGPTSLAYIFYTSGSTGTPKGVVDCHRNVLHNIMRYTNNLGIAVTDRLSIVQSCNFSGTVSSLFSALLNGAALCPYDLKGKGTTRLADWVDREQITIFHSVPIIFEQLLATGNRLASLRIIRLEGDQTHRRHVDLFQRHFDDSCVLVNGLGTTETGIIRQYFMDKDTRLAGGIVPVGYPVEDMHVRLLDDAGRAVDSGTIGEISVQSRYLANGYWGRPDITSRAFTEDRSYPDRRIYRTGDMGRLLADESLEYLGRSDFRAKIRGQTVDLAQIENALCNLTSVNQAVVVAHGNGEGNQRLVAYLVAAAGPIPTISTLRRHLAKSLPEIMLPARYIFLDKLPVDRHSKVSRLALPQPNRERPRLDQAYAAPKTPRQEAIAECFGEILRIDKVGLNDDFVELGGDSLMVAELLFLIERKLSAPCPEDFFFQERTVAALDRNFEFNSRHNHIVPIQPEGTQLPLFCIHNHSGHVLEYRQLAKLLNSDQPVFGVRSTNHECCLDSRLEEIAARYVREIQRVQPTGPYHLCGNCFGGLVAFEVAQQLRQKGEEVALLALIDTACPTGALARFFRRLNIGKNWRELSQLPVPDRLLSLGGKLIRLSRWTTAPIRQRIMFLKAKLFLESDRQLRRNSFETTEFHRQLQERYRPRAYNGDMVLICVEVRKNQLGWKKIGGNGLKIVQLNRRDDEYGNFHLIEVPFVQSLADELNKLLEARVASN